MIKLVSHSKIALSGTQLSPGPAAKVGAWLFVLWGILHIWVGYEGIHQYLTNGTPGLWNIVVGGGNAPRAAFVHTTDAITAFAQGQLLLNFCIDVGGYGVLGLIVGWLILNRASWAAYFIGLFVIGICDLTFLFALVTSGVIEFSIPSISGPIIWFSAIIATPFGMPSLRNK
jgi:hypothetical protein